MSTTRKILARGKAGPAGAMGSQGIPGIQGEPGTPGTPGEVQGNGAGITAPSAFREAVDPEVQAYASATGISYQGKLAIERCLAVLTAGGIRAVLVDLLPAGTGLNHTAAPVTLKLATVTVDGGAAGDPLMTTDGYQFTADIEQRVYFPITAVGAFSLVYDCKNAEDVPSNCVQIQLANTAGLGTAGALAYLPSGAGAMMTAQSGSYAISGFMNSGDDAFCSNVYNPTETIIAWTNSNATTPTLNGYVNGLLKVTTVAGNRTTSPVNRVTVGAWSVDSTTYQGAYMGTIRSVAVFSRVLTSAEVKTAGRALRCLDLRRENIVTYGDSQTAQLQIISGNRNLGNWPLLYSEAPAVRPRARVINPAVNAWSAQQGIDAFAERVAPFGPDGMGVDRATLHIAFGTNDVALDVAAATIYARMKALAALGRAAGFRVCVSTIMHNTFNSAPREAVRVATNALILADRTSFDLVWDLSSIVGSAHDAAFWLDTLHLNNAGNLALAANLAAGGLPRVTAFT
jgi:lysophospholipase L1-like esterase